MGFEVGNLFGQIIGSCNEMQMVLQDDIGKELNASLALEEGPRVEDDLHCWRTYEDWKPFDDRTGEKMRTCISVDFIAISGHKCGACRGAAR